MSSVSSSKNDVVPSPNEEGKDNEQPEDTPAQTIKLVVVGDAAVGKTALLVRYVHNKFVYYDYPTAMDEYAANVVLNNHSVHLELHDTAGDEGYDRLRSLAYPQTNVVLMRFSVENHHSFNNIRDKWWPEIKHNCSHTPYLLVGTKTDQRDVVQHEGSSDNRTENISYAQGAEMARGIGAEKYMECSASKEDGIKAVFEQAIIVAMSPKKRRRSQKCKIF